MSPTQASCPVPTNLSELHVRLRQLIEAQEKELNVFAVIAEDMDRTFAGERPATPPQPCDPIGTGSCLIDAYGCLNRQLTRRQQIMERIAGIGANTQKAQAARLA